MRQPDVAIPVSFPGNRLDGQSRQSMDVDPSGYWGMRRDQVVIDVDQLGWHLESVLSARPGEAYSYTVGLHRTFRCADLAIFGMPSSAMDTALVNAVTTIRQCAQIDGSQAGDELLPGWECELVAVPGVESKRLFPLHNWYYRGMDVPVLQVVWPGLKGRYPAHGLIPLQAPPPERPLSNIRCFRSA